MHNYELQRYVAVGADETRGVVFMLGTNGIGGVIDVNNGPSYSAKADKRRIWSAEAVVQRSGSPVAGVQLSIVALTGHQGQTWLHELECGIQGSGARVQLKLAPVTVDYGIGVLAAYGALMTGDVLQLGVYYD